MIRGRTLVAAVTLALAACSSGPPTVGARLAAPASAVAFFGVTSKDPANARHPYLAVASARGDELRIVDLLDDQPVVGPAKVFPLSVTTAPTPLLVAAAPVGDATGAPDGGADLLVAVSAGTVPPTQQVPSRPFDLQVVETWDFENRIAFSVPIHGDSTTPNLLAPSDAVLSLAAVTIPGGARVLVGASGGKLLVADFRRTPGDQPIGQRSIEQTSPPTLQVLAFDPLDLAVEAAPAAPGMNRVFAATRDALAGAGGLPVFGVAQLQMTPDATTPWVATPLNALAPTRAVAAATVFERDPANPAAFPSPAQQRVYAVLDTTGCGREKAIACGVATLVPRGAGPTAPSTDLAPDPVDPLLYRAPMLVPGVPEAIAIVFPPVNEGSAERLTDPAASPGVPLMYVAPASGRSTTTAVAAVSSSDGRVYLLDLGRYTPLNDVNPLQGVNRALITSVSSTQLPTLGVWTDYPPAAASAGVRDVVNGLLQVQEHVQITPGLTPADTFTIAWRAALSPALTTRQGVLANVGGTLHVAVQSAYVAAPTEATRPIVGARVADPALGVRPGDAVDVACQDGTGATVTVADLVPVPPPSPPAPFPGGALKLASAPAGLCGVTDWVRVTVTIRSSELVLSSAGLGYIGRPPRDQPFVFQYDPAVDVPAAPPSEDLSRVRKARRLFYPSPGPCTPGSVTDVCAAYSWLADPLAPGPVLAFKVGLVGAADWNQLPAGAAITLVVQSGFAPASRIPTTGGAAPVKGVPFDRSTYPDPNNPSNPSPYLNDPVRFYVPFLDDQVVDLSPSRTQAEVIVIR